MKRTIAKVGIASLLLMLALSFAQVYANEFHKGKGEGGPGDLEDVFFAKARMIQENQKELGLTADKIEAIKKLEIETQKAIVKQDADIQIASIDLMAKLHEYPIDVNTADKLIDQQYDLKKTKAKELVDAIAKLKGSLTREQYDMLKQLWKEKPPEPEHRMGMKKDFSPR